MPFKKKRSALFLQPEDVKVLEGIAASRTEGYAKVTRARIILAYARGESISSIARREQTDRPVVERCIDKALSGGIMTGLKDLARSGRPPVITDEDKAWVIHLACSKASDYGYAADRWTISQLAKHIREHAIERGHPALARIGKSGVHNILAQNKIKPHKTEYYLERRDAEFEQKMAQVLTVYKEVQQTREGDVQLRETVLSYDEKPGIQAIENMAPELAPVPEKHAAWCRDYEYKRHGTLSLLAGIDLYDGHILGIVRDRHRSAEFIEFLSLADNYYPADWRIRIILDNHSSHISKETMQWLKGKPNRFEFVYTPKHGSWLNLVEMFFSKMTRAFLRSLRVKSKDELKQRIEKYLDEVNAAPVIFKWTYKLDEVKV
jgi:transposase